MAATRDTVEVRSAAQLRSWLSAEHDRSDGIWLITWKKGAAPDRYVSRGEVLDELLAFGWIDGRRRTVDGQRTSQLVTPRRHDRWTRTYRERAERLIRQQRMHPAGMAAVERAKRAGTWLDREHVDDLQVPDDLAAALAQRGVRAAWDALAPSYRRNVLRWISLAVRQDTRRTRVDDAARATAEGERLRHL